MMHFAQGWFLLAIKPKICCSHLTTLILDNGHVAVLLAVWASSQVAFNYSAFQAKSDPSAVDDSMLPFSL